MSYKNKKDRVRLRQKGCQSKGMHHPNCDGSANEIHHIQPVSYGGSDDDSNLLPVNGWCHKFIHIAELRAQELGLLILVENKEGLASKALEQDRAIVRRHQQQLAYERLKEELRGS